MNGTTHGPKISQYIGKYHHRIVYTEERKPFSQLESLYDVFSALAYILRGCFGVFPSRDSTRMLILSFTTLILLHITGQRWVHRNISFGNILTLKGEEQLSFKLRASQTTLRMKSERHVQNGFLSAFIEFYFQGTVNFMSNVVDANCYLFRTNGAKQKTPDGHCH
jgi:hypothetical protein